MFKSIKGILLFLVIAVIFICLFGALMSMPLIIEEVKFDSISLKSKISTIKFNEYGSIEIEDIVEIEVPKNPKELVMIDLSLYDIDEDYKSFFSPTPDIKSVTIDNSHIYSNYGFNTNKNDVYFYDNGNSGRIGIKNANLITEGNHLVKINYTYENKEIIKQYTNCSVFKIKNKGEFDKLKINMIFPLELETFKVNNKKTVITNKNNIYSIDMTKVKQNLKKEYTEVLINNEVIKDAQIMDKPYQAYNIKNGINNENLNYIISITIIEFTLFFIVLIISKKPKTNKDYIRDPAAVIEPIIAEAIIDKKIGGKELIMSCIANLIYKGNIKNIGNDKIELISLDNLSEYEKNIVDLIFDKDTKITFNQIKTIFISDNLKTKEIFKKFKSIKENIIETIYNDNIYSRKGACLIGIIKIIILVMYINIMYVTKSILNIKTLLFYNIIALIISSLYIIVKRKIKFKVNLNNVIDMSEMCKFPRIMLAFLVLLSVLGHLLILDIRVIIITFILLVVNTIILIKSNTHIFSTTGRIEYVKAIGLKRYIEDYSLMKERDLESVIIWDEYLAYAVAFGIPNKVMNKFNEGLMNVNIILQRINLI